MPLGLNERNIEYVYKHNERKNYRFADDKLLTKQILEEYNYPTPKLLFAIKYFFELRKLSEKLKDKTNFVIKPARGMGGGGILVFDKYSKNQWFTTSGEKFDLEDISIHCSMILSGVYSLDNSDDAVLIEEKIQVNSLLEKISYQGIPDIRIIIFKKTPVMAMIRIPTKESNGRANLHAGGIGIGINIKTGVTGNSYFQNKPIEIHPDTKEKLTGIQIPYWSEILKISSKIQNIIPLGYMGIDFVIDERYGPQILELNVRPGLEIQNVNRQSLKQLMKNL